MVIHPRKAWQLLRQNGPRWYFEVESRAGTGANLDHPLWRFPGVRFLVHMTPVGNPFGIGTSEEFAEGLIENIETFRTNYLSEQPAGTVFPGYGRYRKEIRTRERRDDGAGSGDDRVR